MRSRAPAPVVVALLAVGGCSSGPGDAGVAVSAFGSPTAAALSWFAAVNHKDREASLAHFEAGSAVTADWGSGPSEWPVFSSVQCTDVGRTASDARVWCHFHESDAPAVGNPVTWWTVDLRRHDDGRWLIYDYGQG